MTLTNKSGAECEAIGTSGTSKVDPFIASLILAGLITCPPVAAESPKQFYVLQQKSPVGTSHVTGADIIIFEEARSKFDRRSLVKRLRELRKQSIEEGMTLLNADEILEEVRSRRGDNA